MAKEAISSVVGGSTLILICALAFSTRLFSVIKYESVIHEFDPYFNYRVTQFLTKEGFYNLWNWFDIRTWYPLGRVVGGTVYPVGHHPSLTNALGNSKWELFPLHADILFFGAARMTWVGCKDGSAVSQGLTFTAGLMHNILHAVNIPLNVQEVCVFTAPLFSAFCALASYGLVNEIRGRGPGLVAAALISTVPSYISRSVAGSFDNEGVAIFALVFTFYLFVKTLNTGSLSWATATAMAYLYMVMSWGGYTFIINLLPIHCLVSIVTGRLSAKLYIAYAPLIVLGTLLAGSIPVVGFNAVLMSEHFGAFFAFGVLHAALCIQWIKGILPERKYRFAKRLLLLAGIVILGIVSVLVAGYVMTSPTYGWTGRSLSLLDPTYASKYIPIIASVSEHQPPPWSSYFTDINVLVVLLPAGFFCCFTPLTDASLFLLLYGLTSVYFSGVMVRLMLVLAPAACFLVALAVSHGLTVFSRSAKVDESEESGYQAPMRPTMRRRPPRGRASTTSKYPVPVDAANIGIMLIAILMIMYTFHSTWVSAEMYSAPSIVLQTKGKDGAVHVFDDFREAYSWLRYNTDHDCKVASWWDYGYQTTAMADRTVIVDNNTWNNTHIATVGKAMASPEKKAWRIYRSLDVDYVLVVFGGWIGYPSDDINKFLWMVRIGGGEFPEIKERDYLSASGQYKVDNEASSTLVDSLMYKLSYYNFAEASQISTGQYGYDRVRNTVIGETDIKLSYFEEVFTSNHWMVRIYKLKDPPNRGFKKRNPKRRKPVMKQS